MALSIRNKFFFHAAGFYVKTCFLFSCLAQENLPRLIPVDSGWAANSVNTVVFRKNSLVTWKDNQFIAFYSADQHVMLGKRTLGSERWTIRKTKYTGDASDAHNSISLMVDGEGYLHLSWGQHNDPLNYCKSLTPGSLDLSERTAMTGIQEERITYPEFYRLRSGDLLFFYRSGESGSGNLIIHQYDTRRKRWLPLQQNLIDGEGERNAYWQAYIDQQGTVHLSWVWRESSDVASNHDLCYARSRDGGMSWERSNGEPYKLPITSATAEYVCKIPEGSELINQTSMSADENGNAFIATYWRNADSNIPQYHLVYQTEKEWKTLSLDFRKTPFSLRGGGTKRIPIARPQVMIRGKGKHAAVLMIFRDAERNNQVSAVQINDIASGKWNIIDLTQKSAGQWEPTYDTELWKEKGILNLFVQFVEQADAEGIADMPPQPVYVLEWKP